MTGDDGAAAAGRARASVAREWSAARERRRARGASRRPRACVRGRGRGEKLMILVELLGLPLPAVLRHGRRPRGRLPREPPRRAGEPASCYRLREPEFCLLADDRPVLERSSLLRALAAALGAPSRAARSNPCSRWSGLPADSDDPRPRCSSPTSASTSRRQSAGSRRYLPLEIAHGSEPDKHAAATRL